MAHPPPHQATFRPPGRHRLRLQPLLHQHPHLQPPNHLSSRNPNDRIGIYYDKVDVYAAYHGQQITLPTLLPPTYQGHKDITVWSPFLYGDQVPVAPYVGVSLSEDQIAGTVLVNVRVDGRIRWKVGTFISGRYHLHVNCPAYINFGGRNNGMGVGPAAIKFQLIMDCHVDV
ncbi:UNVERIFIED_CONTAM: NDR1/HIN1-like protein 1 [Sesamum calycinum]|uniref:NDR1/HIN1-like protein 1 n=1 Tax=Sesamum calycinum TaxID=2727403 RepID=A0AAW2SBQ3_9LAMI